MWVEGREEDRQTERQSNRETGNKRGECSDKERLKTPGVKRGENERVDKKTNRSGGCGEW